MSFSESDDIFKIPVLTQSEITALADKAGLYLNSTTGNVEYNGSEIGGGGTVSALPVTVIKSNDDTQVFTRSSPLMVPWNQEKYKDTGFRHGNSTNNSRIKVANDSTYQFGGRIRVRNTVDQRAQPTVKIFVNGTEQDWNLASGYIRNAGSSSDDWTLEFTYEPEKLNANDYVELELSHEDANPITFGSTFIGSESSFWGIKLQGATGAVGATGSGSNIIIQKDDTTVGTTTSTLNIEGNATVTDEGSGKTTVVIGDSGDTYYSQKSTNLNGGTVNAAFGTPLECVPSSGTLEITVSETGDYIIFGRINVGTNLNKDNGAIELIYGIDRGSGATAGPQPYTQNQQAKKNRANGISGTWGGVSLTSGDKVYLFLSTLGDSTTWTEGEIFIATWK